MKIELYKPLFSIDKNWDKQLKDYFFLKEVIKKIPKNFSNIQILKDKISYHSRRKILKIKDLKDISKYNNIQDFYKEHNFIYSFFILSKGLEKNFINAYKFFSFLKKLNLKDQEDILKKLKQYLQDINKVNDTNDIVNDVVENIIAILKYSKNKDIYKNLRYRIYFNQILEIPETILSKTKIKILYLILSEYFGIIKEKEKKLLHTEKIQKIIQENSFLNEYKKYFTNFDKNTGQVELVLDNIGLNVFNYFLSKDLNDFIWLYIQEQLFLKELEILNKEKYYDFSFKVEDNTFRGVASWENNRLIFTVRKIGKPLDLEEKFFLYIPKQLQNNIMELFKKESGLIVISGATGSGKTTFLISILDYLNNNDNINRLVYTIEDPIEYFFESKNYEFIQKQLGQSGDLDTFEKGIKIALRSQPDIILVGETRDFSTAKILLQAAESGHLTLTTMHLRNPRDIITRLSNMTDTEKGLIQDQLSKNLLAVITMGLIPVKIKDLGTGQIVDSILPYFSFLKPDNQIKVLINEGDTINIVALFTEYDKIMSGNVWPKELTLYHYYRLGLINEEQLKNLSDPAILNEIEVLYDRIFVKALKV